MMPDTHNSKCGFVLIHGGGFGPWVWDRLVPLLNLPALTGERTGPGGTKKLRKLTLIDCAGFVTTAIEQAGFERVILVGHSGGGLLLPPIAVQIPEKTAHMVFICANIPPEGKCALDILPFGPRLMNRLVIELQNLGLSMPKKQTERVIRDVLCTDADPESVEWVLSHGVNPEPRALALEPVSRANMGDAPRTFIQLLQDRTLSLAGQAQMVENLGRAQLFSIDTGHTAMVSHPRELADILNHIAAETL